MILNSVLAICFLYLCFKGTKLIREKLGLFAAIVFVFGLISFMNKPPNDSDKEKNIWKLVEDTTLKKKIQSVFGGFENEKITLDKNMMFRINLHVTFYRNKYTNELIPINAMTTNEGIMGGCKWQPEIVTIHEVENDTYEYSVSGTIEAQLLGLTVHNNYKSYTGRLKSQ